MSKSIMENTIEKFGINTNIKYDILKIIKPEWIFEIIKLNVEKVSQSNHLVFSAYNKKERTITLSFESEKDVKKFDNDFHINFFNSINEFLKSKNLKPNKYHRAATLETKIEGKSYIINN